MTNQATPEPRDRELKREVPEPPTRNAARAAAIAAGCGGIAAGLITAALWAQAQAHHPGTRVSAYHAAEAPVVAPAPPLHTPTVVITGPLISFTRAAPACPPAEAKPQPPRSVGERGLPPAGLAGPVAELAVSPNGRVVAGWSGRRLAVSFDGGRSFASHDLPRAVAQAAATDSRVYLLGEDEHLGVVRRNRAPTWKTIAYEPGAGFAATSRHVVWYGEVTRNKQQVPVLAVSTDHGTTWTERDAPYKGNFANALLVDESGRVQLMTGSEAGCGGGSQHRYLTSLGAAKWRDVSWPLDAPTTWMVGAKGWAYAVDEGCGKNDAVPRMCAIGPKKDTAPVAGFTVKGLEDVAIASNSTRSIAVVGNKLVALRRASMTKLSDQVPAGLSHMHLDERYRLWGTARGFIVRLRPGKGWRTVFPSPAGVALVKPEVAKAK